MALKLAALIVIGLTFLGLGVKQVANHEQEKLPSTRDVREVARRSKAEGKSRVEIPAVSGDYPGAGMTIDEALKDFSVVIAEPVEIKSHIIESSFVETWYKFRIIETLSQRPPYFCRLCPKADEPPEELQELRSRLSNEFVLSLDGGTVTVDGVDVTVGSSIPPFEKNRKYLLFLSFIPGGVARLAAGGSGIFKVGSDDALEGIDRDKGKMYADVKNRFGGNLSRLKSRIKE